MFSSSFTRRGVVIVPSFSMKLQHKLLFLFFKFKCCYPGHCKELRPHYAQAALDLQESFPQKKVVLAKMDASKFKSIASRFQVKGFPTIKWFSKGEPSDYTGGRTERAIVSWVKKRLGPATTHLPSPEEHDAFVASADVVVVGYFQDGASDRRQRFLSAALDIDAAPFGLADSTAVHAHAGQAEGAIVLHKKFDGGVKTRFDGDLTTPALQARPERARTPRFPHPFFAARTSHVLPTDTRPRPCPPHTRVRRPASTPSRTARRCDRESRPGSAPTSRRGASR